jgi:hypothetical protein
LTTASASAMAARSRSSVSGMPSPSSVFAEDELLHFFEQLHLGVGEVLLHADAAAATRSAGVICVLMNVHDAL